MLCPTITASPMNSRNAGSASPMRRRFDDHGLRDAGEDRDERRDRYAGVDERLEASRSSSPPT